MTREKKVTPMKLAVGSIRRRGKNGCFAYRCQVNGRRTEISLQENSVRQPVYMQIPITPSRQSSNAILCSIVLFSFRITIANNSNTMMHEAIMIG